MLPGKSRGAGAAVAKERGKARGDASVRNALIVATLCLVAFGCARVAPPPGGPQDTTPPEVVSTFPEDGEVGVDRKTPIRIDFSEEMSRESVERAFEITPAVGLRNFRWSGETVLTEPLEEFLDSTTFIVRIGPGARDYHNVAIEAPYSFAFSTGVAIDDGTIAGIVLYRDEPVGDAVVWACQGPVEPDSLDVVAPCGYTSGTRADGTFTIRHVRIAGDPYDVVAFIDLDRDGRFKTTDESGWVVVNAAYVQAPGDSVGGIEVQLKDPIRSEEDGQ